MTLEQQLLEELEKEQKHSEELMQRLDSQESNFIKQLQHNQRNYEQSLSKIVLNYQESMSLLSQQQEQLMKNQVVISKQLKALDDQLEEERELPMKLQSYMKELKSLEQNSKSDFQQLYSNQQTLQEQLSNL